MRAGSRATAVRTPLFIALLVALSVTAGAVHTAPAAAGSERDERFYPSAVAPAPRFATDGLLFATGVRARCEERCHELRASRDRGTSWVTHAAEGWPGSAVRPAIVGGERVLLAAGRSGVIVSHDDGDTFEPYADGAAAFDVLTTAGDSVIALVRGGEVEVRRGRARETHTIGPVDVTAIPLVHDSQRRLAGAFVIGRQDGQQVVLRCDAAFACAKAELPATGKTLVVTGAFAAPAPERTVILTTNSGVIWRSTDGGRTFVAGSVHGEATGADTSVAGIAFSSDGRTIHAAVFSANAALVAKGFVSGVYRSSDAGSTWARVGRFDGGDFGAVGLAAGDDGSLVVPFVDLDRGTAGIRCLVGDAWLPACSPVAGGATAGGAAGGSASAGGPADGREGDRAPGAGDGGVAGVGAAAPADGDEETAAAAAAAAAAAGRVTTGAVPGQGQRPEDEPRPATTPALAMAAAALVVLVGGAARRRGRRR